MNKIKDLSHLSEEEFEKAMCEEAETTNVETCQKCASWFYGRSKIRCEKHNPKKAVSEANKGLQNEFQR